MKASPSQDKSCAPLLLRTFAGVITIVAGLAPAAQAGANSTNVVLITIDTVRADRVGCYGYRQAHTPNLDALAREGVMFQTAVSAVPLTLPSHCSIMTGTYPTLHGVRDNLGYTLGDSPPTLANLLKAKGYRTAAFVGADVLNPQRGLNRGFDTYSAPFRRRMGRDNPLTFNLQDLQRPAENVISDTLGWMSRQPLRSDKPFFVWIHLYDPHTPYDPPPRFRAMLNDPYDGEISYADDEIGKFFEYMKQHGLYDSSLIIAASDHGESFGEHGEYTHGYFIYDTTLLVPLIIKPPAGRAISRHTIKAPVRTIDIAPTTLQILGIPSPSTMQGTSLLPLMLGKRDTLPTDAAYCETYYPNEFGWSALRAIRRGRYKLIAAPKPELYDLAADPQENHNLYPDRPASASELKSQLETLISRITSHGPTRRPKVSPADVEVLASLGYVGASIPPTVEHAGVTLPDPKDELGAFKVLFTVTQMATQGHCDRAIPLLARLTEEQPDLFLGHMTLAKCELVTGNNQAAEPALNSALRIRPENLEAFFYRGICLFEEGRFEESMADLRAVEKVLPNEPYVHFYLGSIYERQAHLDQALREYQECATLDPNFEVAVYKVGYFLAKSGQYAGAIEQFRRVIAMDPENASAHHNLALALAGSGNEPAAQPEFETACRLNPSYCPAPEKP